MCVVITVPCVPHTVFFVSHIEVYVSVIIIMGWTGSSAEHIAAAALTPTRTLEHLLLHVMSNHKKLLMLQLPLLLLLHES